MVAGQRLFSRLFSHFRWNKFKKNLVFGIATFATGRFLYNIFLEHNDLIPSRAHKIVLAEVNDSVKREEYLYDERVPYLVVGGGPSGYSAAVNILNNDPNSKVLVVSTEKYLPYMRPILTKDIWFNEIIDYDTLANSTDSSIFVSNHEFAPVEKLFDESNAFAPISFLLNSKVIDLNTNTREVTLLDGRKVKFGKIVIATGSEPVYKKIFQPLVDDNPHLLINYNTIDDFIKLHKVLVSGNKTIVVLDGGITGAELCSSLVSSTYKKYDNNIKMIFPESNILSSVLPAYMAEKSTEKFRENGIDVMAFCDISSAEVIDDKVSLWLTNGQQIQADIVVDCSQYNTPLFFAEGNFCKGAACPNIRYDSIGAPSGYKVNGMLQSGGKDIYVCGTAASVFDPTLDCTYSQIPHFVHAIDSAEAVARNITLNKPVAYNGFPIYWIELIDDYKLDFIGLVDSSFPTCSIWREKSSELLPEKIDPTLTQGVIFYYKNDVVVGVVAVNLNHPIGLADKIVRGHMKGEDPKELAKYFFNE